jgi:hypothetical protein
VIATLSYRTNVSIILADDFLLDTERAFSGRGGLSSGGCPLTGDRALTRQSVDPAPTPGEISTLEAHQSITRSMHPAGSAAAPEKIDA